jgi:hypothetical protein
MWWVVWYATTIGSTFIWLTGSVVGARLSLGELLSGSVALGTIAGAWLVFLASCAVGALNGASILLGTGVMLGLAFLNRRAFFREAGRILLHAGAPAGGGGGGGGGAPGGAAAPEPGKGGRGGCGARLRLPLTVADWVCIALEVCLGLYLFPLYSTRMIPEVNGILMSGGSCYGDLPIHMQISNAFLFGCNQKISWSGMMSPIFAGERMTYPFLPDFHAAVVVAAGGTLRQGFLWPGFLMACALWALLFYFSLRVSRSVLGAALAVLLTIFAGGLGGPRWVHERGWQEAMRSDVVQHDWSGEWKHLWFAFIPHILLPQRGGNFAYPLVAFILILLLVATEQMDVPQPPLPHMLLGRPRKLSSWDRAALLRYTALFAGALPMVQAHSFIGVGVVVAVVAVGDAHKWLADPVLLWAGWVAAGAIAAATGGPQMLLFRKTVSEGFYGSFMQYGWLFKKDLYLDFGTPHDVRGFLRFWWHSLGPTVPLFLLGLLTYTVEACVAARQAARLGASATSHVVSQMEKALFSQRGGAFFSLGTDVAAQLAGGDDGDGDRDSPTRGVSGAPVYAFKGALSPRSNAAAAAGGGSPAGGSGSPGGGGGGWLSYTAWADAAVRAAGAAREGVKARPWLSAANRALWPLNALSVAHGRALDLLKLAAGGFAVFLLGNYVNFQPWDRDNAKLYYVFIFVASAVNGGLLAAPLEAALGVGPGRDRLWVWLTLHPTPAQEVVDYTGGNASSASNLGALAKGGGGGGDGEVSEGGSPLPPRLVLAPARGVGGGGDASSGLPPTPRTPSRASAPPLPLGGDGDGGGGSASAVRASPSASGIRNRGGGGGVGGGGGGGEGSGAAGSLNPNSLSPRALPPSMQAARPERAPTPQRALGSPSKSHRGDAPRTPCTIPMGAASVLGIVALPLLLYLSMLSGYILLAQESMHWAPMFDYDAM